MIDHNVFYYPYESFTNAQLPLLKVAALYFDKLYMLDLVGSSWDTIGADYVTCNASCLFYRREGKKSVQRNRLNYSLKTCFTRIARRPREIV